MNYISKVIDLAGLSQTAKACGISYQAVRKWEANQSLPRTEFTDETNYAEKLSALVNNQVTADQLLSMKPERKSA
ncbi:helix-turn-helix domain-containing protein [uncultured Paraglaciecola sp.]|uniref:helix-turn-helix domain-containing protein n=1 Tax=uncultured Paraglaciecola sp. TaxID=1765024 RepID=UPI0026151B9E|nr:helix-turn-helix domain-containing protein [uncultured Paraglaciecola sp.]